ncbi:hypothetical protein HER32_06590 [Hymenobacter sp. BT18]|uniref:hypothetical protein n=1 Tax=Hymenobacter sp. BT18 TaxID=2835648 RepID=UPI00143ED1FB|nr:hypothetical protein [Hymenobacter sp. BT18]QIX60860.1 hypothetical protein HER32_06590 [Hymenobacter sp. BT18]
MIGLLHENGWLDLGDGSISVEINNPLFQSDSVPGTTTYPFTLPLTPGNRVKLNHPLMRLLAGLGLATEPIQCYVGGLLWKVGTMVFEEFDEQKQEAQVKVVFDAGDLQARVKGKKLAELDLGEIPLALTYDAADYALPMVRNPRFYADVNSAFGGWLNYFHGGQYLTNAGQNTYCIVPFPRLVPLLRRVLATVGYALEGEWLDAAEAGALVVYSDRAADVDVGGLVSAAESFLLQRHVPNMTIGELLVSIQSYLALGYTFDSMRRVVRVHRLADVLADARYLVRRAGPARSRPAERGGFTLQMELEQDDELTKTRDTSWAQLVVGAGQQALSPKAGTLLMEEGLDTLDTARRVLTPAVQAKGGSPALGLGDESRCGLRLLSDYGLQPASDGSLYPLASSGTVNWEGTPVGTLGLHWNNTLYAQRYQAWLAFLDSAPRLDRKVEFYIADLRTLEPTRKELVAGQLCLWEKVSLELHPRRRLETAAFTYRQLPASAV